MRDKLASMAERWRWDEVVVVGLLAVVCLVGLAVWASDATQNFAFCNPPHHVLSVKHNYVCPTKYTHTWTVHTHAALIRGLIGGALVVAVVAIALALTLARRRRPPVVGAM